MKTTRRQFGTLENRYIKIYMIHQYQENMNWREMLEIRQSLINEEKVYYVRIRNFTVRAVVRVQQ